MLSECGRGQNIRWVLVSGASGGMGTALVQMAKAAGHRVIATVGQERKPEHSLAMGADQVFNYREDDLKAGIAAATEGTGIDVWFEAYAGPKLADVLGSMASWGKLVLYNAGGGHPPGPFFDAWRQHMERCVSIQYFSSHVWEHDRATLMRFGLQTIELILAGKVTPPPGTFFALADAAEAHRLLESGQHVGRIFLRP